MKKSLLTVSLLASALLCTNVFAAPKILYKDMNAKTVMTAHQVPAVLNTAIAQLKAENKDIYEIVVHKFADHYRVFVLSSKVWGFKEYRVEAINGQMRISNGDNDKHSSPVLPGVCPDTSVEVVAISAFPGVASVNEAIALVAKNAETKFKTMTILSDAADGQVYRNWFACSNLKAFYSIGHGANTGMLVGNGDFIEADFFEDVAMRDHFKKTTVIINACQVYNEPFGTAMMFGNSLMESDYIRNPGANAYQYIGGHTNLLMYSSEMSTACLLSKAIDGGKMDYAELQDCIGKDDMHARTIGIAHTGRKLAV